MSAILSEETKEMGIYRAMGMTKSRVIYLYFYEALILVLVATFFGMVIGISFGYIYGLLFNLLLETKDATVFFFPTE